MKNTSPSVQARLIHWNGRHALVMLAGTVPALAVSPLWTLVPLAAGSFAALIWSCRRHWSAPGGFGPANAVTAARLLGILALPQIAAAGHLAVAGCAVALFALDGVDGWLARRLGLSSEFGEYLDKETDAFFMLMLCLLLYKGGRLEAWILLPGLLRYGFVAFMMLARPPAAKERQSAKGKWIFSGMISALIAAFTPFPALYRPYAVLMTVLLIYSFADALLGLYRPPRQDPGA